MSDALESLNGLIVPLTDQGLLLPNVAVAELVSFRITRDKPGAPNWFLGWTRWRDQQVPVVDPYVLLNEQVLRGEITEAGEPRAYISQSVQLADEPELLMIPDLEAIELALEEAGLLQG